MSTAEKPRSQTHVSARSRTLSMRASFETGRLTALVTLARARPRYARASHLWQQ
jgi:hypothetical protein